MDESIDCNEAAEQLQDYLQRELTPDTEAEMRAHIERCRPCFQHARFEENFLAMLEAHARRSPCPSELRRRILLLLRAEAARG